MKPVKFTLVIVVMLVFFGLNETYGQWIFNGTHINNTNVNNVGIGIGAAFVPTEKLHVNTFGAGIASMMLESNYVGAPMRAIGYVRIKNTAGTGPMFNMVLRKNGADHEMLQSCFDGAMWREFMYYNYTTRKYEVRNGIINAEFQNTGDFLLNNGGDVGIDILPDNHGLNVIHYTSGKAAVQGLDASGGLTYASGMLGVLDGPATGVPIYAFNIGALGIKPNNGWNGAGVCGWNADALNTDNYGGLFIADGASPTGPNYGLYSTAMHSSGSNFAGKFAGRVEVAGHPSSTEAADYTSTVFKSTVNHTVSTDTRAVDGVSTPAEGYGIGVYGTGGYRGVQGFAAGGAYAYSVYGVYGSATGTAGTRIGVYGTASGGTTNWAAYFAGDAYISSDLRIATTTQATGYALSVNGKVACEEVLVEDLVNWPDYVFADDYKLMSLDELEKSIKENNHLPGLPSAAEIEENGLQLGDMQKRLMEKVEELTLYTIEQGKVITSQGNVITELQQKLDNLEKETAKIRKSKNQ
jgi:hypothetical protein